MEVILGDFGISQFSPIVVSSVSATVVSRHFLGNFPAFVIPKYEMVSVYEMIPYTILGFAAAFAALAFINILYKTEDLFEEFKFPEMFKPVVGGLMIGILGIFIPHIYGVGYGTITLSLTGQLSWYFLLLLVVMKIVATSVTIGSGGSGGVFAPSLFIGANLGGFIGTVVHKLFPTLTATPGAYALVGMGAVAAGAMHAPITAIVIIFELTNNYTIILPLMLSCIISVLITTRLKKDSIYTLKLSRRGLDLSKGQELNILKSLKVSQVMSDNFEKVFANASFRTLMDLTVKSPHVNFFIVNKDDKLLGILSIHDLRSVIYESENLEPLLVAYDIMAPATKIFTPEDTLDVVMNSFGELNIDEVPVVNNLEDKKIIAVVSKNDVINIYNREVFKRDTVSSFSSYLSSVGHLKEIQLTPGEFLTEFEVPGKFIGKKIRDLDVSKRFNVEIVLIKRKNYDYSVVTPGGDYCFVKGDILIVIGKKEDIAKLKGFHI